MGRYRKKPVVIEAEKFTTDTVDIVREFCPAVQGLHYDEKKEAYYIIIPTLEGDHRADEGDYIIKGVKGEFYPCKPDIFEQTYDAEDLKMDDRHGYREAIGAAREKLNRTVVLAECFQNPDVAKSYGEQADWMRKVIFLAENGLSALRKERGADNV